MHICSFCSVDDYTTLSPEPNELLFSPTHTEQSRTITTLIIVCVCFSLSPVDDDYTALSPEPNEVSFLPAQTEQSRTITIPINNDEVREGMEQFTVQLSLPSGSTGVVLDQDSATVQIVDEDRECPRME